MSTTSDSMSIGEAMALATARSIADMEASGSTPTAEDPVEVPCEYGAQLGVQLVTGDDGSAWPIVAALDEAGGLAFVMLTPDGLDALRRALGPDVRDRIIDRLRWHAGEDVAAYHAVPFKDTAAPAWRAAAPCWVPLDDEGLVCADPEPMAPDEVAYFEARRASDG